jgi:hypothetical protein
VPITMQVESSNPSCRRSSVRVVVKARGALNWFFINRAAQPCQLGNGHAVRTTFVFVNCNWALSHFWCNPSLQTKNIEMF